MVTEEFDQ